MDLWEARDQSNPFMITRKKRGRKPGFDRPAKINKETPMTPFRALRYQLRVTQQQLADRCDVSLTTINGMELGKKLPEIQLAKRLVEEARLLGVVVTLDELYAHVVPLQKSPKRLLEDDQAAS